MTKKEALTILKPWSKYKIKTIICNPQCHEAIGVMLSGFYHTRAYAKWADLTVASLVRFALGLPASVPLWSRARQRVKNKSKRLHGGIINH